MLVEEKKIKKNALVYKCLYNLNLGIYSTIYNNGAPPESSCTVRLVLGAVYVLPTTARAKNSAQYLPTDVPMSHGFPCGGPKEYKQTVTNERRNADADEREKRNPLADASRRV